MELKTQIDSKDNPKIKNYCKLKTSKKYRKECGEFVIEGARICLDTAKEAVSGRVCMTAVFASNEAVKRYLNDEDAEILNRASGGRFFIVSDEAAAKMSGTDNSQGIFAQVRKIVPKPFEQKLSMGGKFCVLDNLQDPGNVGTILRTCDALGVDAVFLCGCCDLYNPKTVRATMGSIFHLDLYENESFEQTVFQMNQSDIMTISSVIDSDAVSLTDFDFPENCALVIGNEGNGIPKEHTEKTDRKITIKMKGRLNSLNAATAACILLWEMTK